VTLSGLTPVGWGQPPPFPTRSPEEALPQRKRVAFLWISAQDPRGPGRV